MIADDSGQAVVGRESELAEVAAFLDGVPGGALLVEGPAGIGKTTLWLAGIAAARARGQRVLTARPSGSEAQLSFAALGDLLGAVDPLVLDVLPRPQRHALEVALLRAEPDAVPEPRALGVATTAVLHELARVGPLLVAVDDFQWLDGDSAAALLFALRRLVGADVRVLAALRNDDDVGPPDELLRALPTSRLAVAALSFGATRRLVQAHLGTTLPRPALRKLHETSGGNPFFALELARALVDAGTPAGVELPIPRNLRLLIRQRLRGLPAPTLDALLVAAALADPRLALLDVDALDPALAAGIVVVEGDRLRFGHPLLRAEVYAEASPARRLDVHRRLAGAVTQPEERARHLALSQAQPDEEVAATLEAAADTAVRRGAPQTAAELLERSAALTPPGDEEHRLARLAAASRRFAEAGDEERARRLLAPVALGELRGSAGADVLLELARDEPDRTIHRRLVERALSLVSGDAERRVELLLRLGYAAMHDQDAEGALAAAEEAVELAEARGPRLLLAALSRFGWLAWAFDDARSVAALERALALEAELGAELEEPYYAPGTWLGWLWIEAGEPDRGRPLLERQFERAYRAGNEAHAKWLLYPLTELELASGNAVAAVAHAADGYARAEEIGSPHALGAFAAVRALALAVVGELDEARRLALESLDHAHEVHSPYFAARARRALGAVEWAAGDARAALEALGPNEELLLRGIRTTAARASEPDLVEALAASGELERARALVERIPPTPSAGARARALRLDGTVAAAEGRLDDAVASLTESLALAAALSAPFERARTELALGSALRRAKRRREARERLESAAAAFEVMGSAAGAAQARAELERIGGRAPSRDALTTAERRVAELAAAGKTNKEVAAALYVSVRTVEAALTRAYGKLGVRSRTELANRLST